MRWLLLATATLAAYWFYSGAPEAQSTKIVKPNAEARVARIAEEARARREREKIIEDAIARLEEQGIKREELKEHFREEIEEEVGNNDEWPKEDRDFGSGRGAP